MLDGVLSRDDYELQLGHLKSQRVQTLLLLESLDAGIRQFERLVASCPVKGVDVDGS